MAKTSEGSEEKEKSRSRTPLQRRGFGTKQRKKFEKYGNQRGERSEETTADKKKEEEKAKGSSPERSKEKGKGKEKARKGKGKAKGKGKGKGKKGNKGRPGKASPGKSGGKG